MSDINPRPAPFRLAPETLMLMADLRELSIGEVVTWEALEKKRGIEYRKRYHLVVTAVRRLESENIHIRCVVGVGLKALTKEEAVQWCEGNREHISRRIKRQGKTLTTISPDELSDDGKLALYRERLFAGALMKITRAKADTLNRLIESQSGKVPPIKSLLAALADKESKNENA